MSGYHLEMDGAVAQFVELLPRKEQVRVPPMAPFFDADVAQWSVRRLPKP